MPGRRAEAGAALLWKQSAPADAVATPGRKVLTSYPMTAAPLDWCQSPDSHSCRLTPLSPDGP
ncbi:unnamed protein product [Gemmata massiliana]|uniref:Uncharacterized protein n=1 Tax=Gemmata massiliana TaxID=1210884 RepID=A0A6P2CY22_9BACT|nr:hypothetical protein [Gemmata massiliana]VTR94028.1 unnamed protein product [Gemmata massiliana]